METSTTPDSREDPVTFQNCLNYLLQCQTKSNHLSECLKIILLESVEIEIEKFRTILPAIFEKIDLKFNLITDAWQIFLKLLGLLTEFVGDPINDKTVPNSLRQVRRLFPSAKEFVEFREFQATILSRHEEKILLSLRQILQDTYFLIINPKILYPTQYCQKYRTGKCRWGDRCVYIHE